MTVTNEEIYKKLEDIHKLLGELKEEEDQVIAEEHKIEIGEEKLIELLSKKVNKEFDNIADWKRYVWETCEQKKSVSEKDKIDFMCKKTGKACRFIDCFRNRIE